ncbi:TIGR02996 domain-containing protein [bacterium]|nr:TIGR02996 domain-containing protein [bacterium]
MSGGLSRAILDAIVAAPDEDTPRLVYADWCDDNGLAERAEFVRVQVERARLPAWDAAQVPLRLRERELLHRYGEGWLAEMPAVPGARWEGFRRGVVAEVSFSSFEAMRKYAHACRAVAPVEAVTVRWPRRGEARTAGRPITELQELTLTGRPFDDEIAWLAGSPQLATVRTLAVLGLSADDLVTILASPHLSGLRALRLPSNGLGNAGVLALTQSPALTRLGELTLSGPGYYAEYYDDPIINAAGMRRLAGWPGLAGVRSLTLAGSDVRRDGLRALLRSPHAAGIKELSLRSSRLDGQAMAEFEAAVSGLRLETLDLGENVLKDVGTEYVASAPCLAQLKLLRLDRCEISRAGARLLAKKATFLGGLGVLDVGHNHFGAPGLGALLERKPPVLHTLGLRDNDLLDKGAELLAGSPASDPLLDVDLSRNDLGADAALALGATPHLRGLLALRLTDNRVTGAVAAGLKASPLGQRLTLLEVADEPPPRPLAPAHGPDDIPF